MKRNLNSDEVEDGAAVAAEHGTDAEEHPKRRAVPAVVEQNDLRTALLSDGLADFHDRPPGSARALEDGGVLAQDLAARVARELEEARAGEDDRVARDVGVGDCEAIRQFVERVPRVARVTVVDGSLDFGTQVHRHRRWF